MKLQYFYLICLYVKHDVMLLFLVGTSIDDISMIVGLTPDAEQNLEDAFYAVLNNDMRPLLKMGMPEGEWFDTSAMFNHHFLKFQ